MEFKLAEGANSGVFFRVDKFEVSGWWKNAIELQIHDSTDGTKYGMCGAVYDCMAPAKQVVRPAGQWNHYTITAKANKIYVVFNGEQIIDMDLDRWIEPGKNPDGTDNKFAVAYKDLPCVGHIGFQDHGDPIWFRNMKIRPLEK